MAQLPADRSKLALAQSNQNPLNVLSSSANKNALTEAYDTIDALYNYATGLVSAGTLSRLGLINVKDYNASGLDTTFTGSIASGSKVLTLTTTPDFVAGQGINLQGAFEVASLTLTAGASSSANCTVTLNGVAFTVALTSGDTATEVATAIRAATFAGWTTGGTGTTVTFTSITSGTKTDATYSAGTTSATGTMTTTTQGTADQISTVSSVSGLVVTIADSSTRTIAAGSIFHDDTVAIQAAINEIAPFVWGGSIADTIVPNPVTLFFPPGIYLASDTLLFNPSVTYFGYGATIKAHNFADKSKFVVEAKVFDSSGSLATGWTYSSNDYSAQTYVSMNILGLNFDGETDGVFGGLSLTQFIYSIVQDSEIKGYYVGLRLERTFNNRFTNLRLEGNYAGLAVNQATIERFTDLHSVGKGDCSGATDVANLETAKVWLYRDNQDSNYKNYGRGMNLCWFNSLNFDTLTVEGCYAIAFTLHCSFTVKNLYSEFIGYSTWAIPSYADSAMFFGSDTKLTITDYVWTSSAAMYIFDGAYSTIRLHQSNQTDYASAVQTIKGIKVGTSTQLIYDPKEYTLSSDSSALTLYDEQIVAHGTASGGTYTKYQSGLMIVTGGGFYVASGTVPYELTWTLPAAFKDANSFTVSGMRAGTGTYKRGATVQAMEIVDGSNVILSFSANDVTYNVVAIGQWK